MGCCGQSQKSGVSAGPSPEHDHRCCGNCGCGRGCTCRCCCACCCRAGAPHPQIGLRIPRPGAPGGGEGLKPDDPWTPVIPKGGDAPPPKYRIPPTTPIVKTYEQYSEKDKNYVEMNDYFNGWCAIAWLVRTAPGKGGTPWIPKPDKKTPDPARLMSDPTQDMVNKVAAAMKAANAILWSCKNIGLRLCEVIVLDARRLYITPLANQKFHLSDTFTNGVAVINHDDNDFDHVAAFAQGADDESDGVKKIGGSVVLDSYFKKLRKPCIHLFFVAGVKDAKDTDPNHKQTGVTAKQSIGAKLGGNKVNTSMCLIDSQATDLAETIAHEIGHGLELKHSDAKDPAQLDPDPAVQADKNNLMKAVDGGKSLQESQCKAMRAYLENNLAPACPDDAA
jgi:hypothetical protein